MNRGRVTDYDIPPFSNSDRSEAVLLQIYDYEKGEFRLLF